MYYFNQSLHDGQQNTAINMKYDTLQTQMDTEKKKLPKETYGWKYLKKKKRKEYIYIYIIFHI